MDFCLIGQFSFFDPSTLWAIFQMILGLGFVIFVHELGHFLVAKACGVKCEKFYLGFDAFDIKIGDRVLIPRKLVHWKWGETEYGVGILPLGGYVKMLGQDDNPAQIAEERRRSMEGADEVEGEVAAPKLDPRSYQAKSVPQRMAIISAGVIMNLIFAVIFAAVAFGTGVNYEPPHIGSTVPGSPAWENNLDGATILAVGEQSTRERYFTFGHLREAIVFDGNGEPINLEVQKAPTFAQLTGEPSDNSGLTSEKLEVLPTTNLINVKGAESLPALGVGPAMDAILAGSPPAIPGKAASKAEPPLETGDRIVSIQGKSIVREFLDENGNPYRQHNVFLLKLLLSQYTDETVEMVVERKDKDGNVKLVTTRIPPNPMRTIGLTMEMGPIEAIQKGSPAAEAGLKHGDRITKIDGEPVGNPFTLQSRMTRLAKESKTVELTIERSAGESESSDSQSAETNTLTVSLTPRTPRAPSGIDENKPLAVDTIGIAFYVNNVIASTHQLADEVAGKLQPGTTVKRLQFKPANAAETQLNSEALKPIDLESKPQNWPLIDALIQQSEPGMKVEITVSREGEVSEVVELDVADLTGFHTVARGFPIAPEQMPYRAKSVWESIQLGFNQTWLDATKVLRFLGKLVRGDIPVTGLGGPGTIVMAATSEASQGTSRLLLFLTLLSANLAIINFLPIPILDGGHMVFLAYEGIFRRPVSERLQIILSFGGLIFIIGLMLLVISLDVWRWSGLF